MPETTEDLLGPRPQETTEDLLGPRPSAVKGKSRPITPITAALQPYTSGEKRFANLPLEFVQGKFGPQNKYLEDALRLLGGLTTGLADIPFRPVETLQGLGEATKEFGRTILAASQHQPPPADILAALAERPFTKTAELLTPPLLATGVVRGGRAIAKKIKNLPEQPRPRMEQPVIKEYDAAAVEAKVKANVEAMKNSRSSVQEQIRTLAEEQGLQYLGLNEAFGKPKTGEIRAGEHNIQDPITTSSFGVPSPEKFLESLEAHRKLHGFDISGKPLEQLNTLEKFVQAIDEAVPLRKEQKQLYSEELSKRSARVAAAGREVYGEKGLFAQLGELKGPLPKKTFEAIRSKFSGAEIDGLFASIEDTPTLLPFEKVNSKIGLQKLLDGAVPTEGEINLLRETFPKEVVEAVLSKRPLLQRFKEHIGEVLNLPRAVLASVDLSAPFRQGVFMMGRPKAFGRAFGSMFKYFGSEKAYHGLIESIKARPTYLEMKRGGLSLTEIGGSLLKREERFMSQLAEKIPGFGRVARASNRAYTGFLDKLRADVFDADLALARKMGIEPTNELLQSMGDFINAGTGRGKFGLAETGIIPKGMQSAAVAMNGVFFSPRLMASRLNLLNPNFYVQMHPFVRRQALKTLFGTAGIWATTYGLWKLNGGEVGVDSRSADFGKLKVGNTRYDVLGGFQQYIRLASQLISGEMVSSTTGRTITLGEGYKPLTRKDIAIRFFENKESPIASFITGMLSGTDATGRRFDVPAEITARFIPMMVQDLYELSQEEGAEGLLGGIPAVFGVGVQSYGKQELKRGENVIGESTVGIGPIDNLSEKIRTLVLGRLPIRQSPGFSVDAYYDQMEKLPVEQKQQIFQEIVRNNRDLAERLLDVKKRRILGITIKDEDLKTKGISSGERALAIKKQLDKLPDLQDKSKLMNEYIAKGIVTSEVLLQINKLHARELQKEK